MREDTVAKAVKHGKAIGDNDKVSKRDIEAFWSDTPLVADVVKVCTRAEREQCMHAWGRASPPCHQVLTEIRFQYDSSLTIKFVLMGASGRGKTSLYRVLQGKPWLVGESLRRLEDLCMTDPPLPQTRVRVGARPAWMWQSCPECRGGSWWTRTPRTSERVS